MQARHKNALAGAALVLPAILVPVAGISQENAIVRMTEEARYEPASVTIRVGDTITWLNDSRGVGHTVTADPDRAAEPGQVALPPGAEGFASGLLPPGTTFEHRFEVPGRYVYFCETHTNRDMTGEVIVE